MTVKELIEELQKMPQNMEVKKVYVGSDFNSYDEILSVIVDREWNMLDRSYGNQFVSIS